MVLNRVDDLNTCNYLVENRRTLFYSREMYSVVWVHTHERTHIQLNTYRQCTGIYCINEWVGEKNERERPDDGERAAFRAKRPTMLSKAKKD